MSLEDYENTETQFKENSVLKVKKFKQVDVLGQPGKEVMSQVDRVVGGLCEPEEKKL